jgi:hydrogenase-4 component B
MDCLHITLLCWLMLSGLFLIVPSRWYAQALLRFANIPVALLTLVISVAYASQATFLSTTPVAATDLPWGFYFQWDALSAFFTLLLSISVVAVTCFGQSYFCHVAVKQQKVIQTAQAVFILAMLMVFSAGNSFTFLFAWELMTLSSYLLVVFNRADKAIHKAGFLYLGIAHVVFLAIAVAFFLLASSPLTIGLASGIFICALLGFGAKAGLFPLHVWLPEAHPAAPSPISALMSGVMLKTAVYGLIRFSFDWLLPYQQAWWGYTLIIIGLLSMLLGVIHAAVQTDMKRLLAYSSMENLGLITVALGLAIVFYQYQRYALANVALLIVLLHSLSHSIFKSLLFLTTGSILHATGERNIGKLGGLIQKMPWVSGCALIGCLAMAGLPLLSGFISEWLYLRLFFNLEIGQHFGFALLSSVMVALSVLVFGLAGFVIVKFFGVAFLGQPRESILVHAQDSSWYEKIAVAWLALWCLLLGLWPQYFVWRLQTIVHTLSPKFSLSAGYLFDFAWSTPAATTNTDAFNPALLALMLLFSLLLITLLLRKFSPLPLRKAIPWDCGFNLMTPRMQESAEGFAQPFKQIFSKVLQVQLTLPAVDDPQPHYHSKVTDRIGSALYRPLTRMVLRVVAITKWIQQGKIAVYLSYILMTLLLLLVVEVWL